MSCLTYAQAEELTEATSNNVLPTIKLEAQGNWLEDANAERVQKHAGARTIITRNRLDEVAATSIKDALKQVPLMFKFKKIMVLVAVMFHSILVSVV